MKVRQGFVSNSSSSSFILVFEALPESVEDLKPMLDFREVSTEFTEDQYTEEILNDLQGDEPDDEELRDLFRNTLYWEVADDFHRAWDEKNLEKRNKLREEVDAKLDKLTNETLESFKKKSSGKVVRVVSYCDNDGTFYSNLEHGGLFDKIEHVYISQH